MPTLNTSLATVLSVSAALLVGALTAVLFWPDTVFVHIDEYFGELKFYRYQPGLTSLAEVLDDFGRRIFVLPLMILVLLVVGRRLRSWRPLILGLGAFFVASVVVGLLKFVTARTSPRLGGAEFLVPELVDSIGLYPSGHAANAVVAWGAIVYFASQGWSWSAERTRWATAGVVVIVVIVGVASSYLQYHWVSDLVAGALVGASALFAAIAIDQRIRGRMASKSSSPRRFRNEGPN